MFDEFKKVIIVIVLKVVFFKFVKNYFIDCLKFEDD